MLNYPKSYEMLAEEELEYTSGGGDVDFMLALAAGGLAGIVVSSILYVVNGENIRNRKKQNARKIICRMQTLQSVNSW